VSTVCGLQWQNIHKATCFVAAVLQIEGYSYPFEIFVGKESADFKPKYEQVDNLKVGDIISVFYYETVDTQREGVNRFFQ